MWYDRNRKKIYNATAIIATTNTPKSTTRKYGKKRKWKQPFFIGNNLFIYINYKSYIAWNGNGNGNLLYFDSIWCSNMCRLTHIAYVLYTLNDGAYVIFFNSFKQTTNKKRRIFFFSRSSLILLCACWLGIVVYNVHFVHTYLWKIVCE